MNPEAVVARMMQQDNFSQWLGIELLQCKPGYCRLKMILRNEMCNGFGIAHGGILFSLADSALAFASNTYGKKALSVEVSVSFLQPVLPNTVLTAIAEEQHRSRHFGRYDIAIAEGETTVALFKGTVYFKD